MMNKFAHVVSLTLASIALICSPGCKTSSTIAQSNIAGSVPVTNTVTTFLGTPITPGGVYAQMRGGAAQASIIAMRADPNTVLYLQAVYQVLEATVTSGSYDPTALSAALAAIPKGGIHNPQALEAIASGFAMFEIIEPYLQAQVNSKNAFIIPALQGIADGINDALQIAQSSPVTPAPVASANPVPAVAPATGTNSAPAK
jgi:hypothetical protein